MLKVVSSGVGEDWRMLSGKRVSTPGPREVRRHPTSHVTGGVLASQNIAAANTS